jgi:hypothetical protein
MNFSDQKLLLITTLLFMVSLSYGQILTNSTLPIVVINTGDNEIPDEPKITASMGIIYNGEGNINNLTDPFNHYNGSIGIETRGNSTQSFDKKTYSFELRNSDETDNPMEVLGMGEEEDWILHAMVIDKTQLRIPMSFYLSQQMGHYASNWRYVEVVLDGDYRGLYILTEKLKRDKNRVDIAKLTETDIAGDEVTGGYILRIDWLDDDNGLQSNYDSQGEMPLLLQWYYPKAENIQVEQTTYITNWMHTFEDAVFADNYTNNQGVRYNDYIDVTSFTDFLLINELSKNSDGYKLSSYVHKDKDSNGGKLKAGPIWDFDQTYGMSLVCSNNDYTGWTYLQNQEDCGDLESMPMWWQEMMSDDLFVNHLKCRWETMREGAFHRDSIHDWIDNYVNILDEPLTRNFTKWDNFIGESIWIEPDPIPQSYEEEIIYMKDWIDNRLVWMDANILGDCTSDVVAVDDLEFDSSIQVFPSPAKDQIFIRSDIGNSITIYNSIGQKIHSYEQNENEETLNVTAFPRGIYFITISNDDFRQSKKIIIN